MVDARQSVEKEGRRRRRWAASRAKRNVGRGLTTEGSTALREERKAKDNSASRDTCLLNVQRQRFKEQPCFSFAITRDIERLSMKLRLHDQDKRRVALRTGTKKGQSAFTSTEDEESGEGGKEGNLARSV
ncbi:hypothetical protein KM043_014072 [Ampulex compressa]|nr:hypothetical protein KM043_014072 [Ampulex compressa]